REHHLFSLQELDSGLLSDTEEGEPGEEVTQDVSPPRVEVSEVQVSVLSPQCWPISPLCYMEDHSKHFPESLSGSLQRFTDFYTKRRFLHSRSKPNCVKRQMNITGNI
ncbi:cullin-9-like, partial [Ascaphus truei]|uniref:cullin-9-like n=1 Tax=Ascaphus truei TaxID=8439 RepID=UPI003F5969E4